MEGFGSDSGADVAGLLSSGGLSFRSNSSTIWTDQPLSHLRGGSEHFLIYVLPVYFVQGFYVITYGLGIYILNLLIGFLSPKIDPEIEALDGASLPTKDSDEFRPFIRDSLNLSSGIPSQRHSLFHFFMIFSILDVPVFWPILLCYWVVLFVLTMKRQIMHMIKYKYVPFNIGKQRYITGRRSPASTSNNGSPRD